MPPAVFLGFGIKYKALVDAFRTQVGAGGSTVKVDAARCVQPGHPVRTRRSP